MTIRIAINGYGRIGRNILRALYESGQRNNIKIVAINDLGDVNINAHLTHYDTTHGRFTHDVSTDGDCLIVDGDRIKVLQERNPADLPWAELNVDVVMECTGLFIARDKAGMHLEAGAKKVIISAPAGKDVDATVVYGVNHNVLTADHKIISNASCTTNCLAPIAKVLHNNIGIESGLMNTIHAFTLDQKLVDGYHTDIRRARCATQSMIPAKTGAAAAVGLVLPELNGRLDGFAIRVPTINVSVVDFTFSASRETSADEVNQLLLQASHAELQGVLGYNDAPLVSTDFNHNSHSSIVDSTQTKAMGKLVKVLSWYDNEWGFSNRMLDTACALMQVATHSTKAVEAR